MARNFIPYFYQETNTSCIRTLYALLYILSLKEKKCGILDYVCTTRICKMCKNAPPHRMPPWHSGAKNFQIKPHLEYILYPREFTRFIDSYILSKIIKSFVEIRNEMRIQNIYEPIVHGSLGVT